MRKNNNRPMTCDPKFASIAGLNLAGTPKASTKIARATSKVPGTWFSCRRLVLLVRYVPPEEFDELQTIAKSKGFKKVVSGPFVRSSYHARDIAETN